MTLTRTSARALTSLVLRASPEFFVSDVLGSHSYDKQREMARSLATNRRTAVVGCNSCIAPETRILNADTGEERRVDEIIGEWPVWSVSESRVIRAIAQRPFIKGIADLYHVTLADGSTFTATLGHRVLTPSGWRQLAELASNVLVQTGSSSPASPACACGPSTRASYEARSTRTVLDSRAGYPLDPRSDGGQLLASSVAYPIPPPSPNDVRARNQLQCTVGHIRPYPQSDRLPRSVNAQVQGRSYGETGYQAGALSYAPSIRATQAAPPASQTPSAGTPVEMVQTPDPEPAPCRACHCSPVEDSLCSCNYLRTNCIPQWSAVQSIKFLRRDIYYDLHVPGPNNYLAEGVFQHNSGKDYMTARLVMWWMETHSPAKALVYGPTHRQVQDIVFSEMRTAYDNRPIIDGLPLRGQMYETARYVISHESYAIGFATKTTTGTTEVFNLQGFHSPNLLVVITEAHAITQAEYDTVLRLHPARVIMTGNAFVQSGPFYDAFHDKSEGWYQIHIEADDTPNLQGGDIPGLVTQDSIDEALREWGMDSPLYQGSILARFPDNLEEMLCPLHDVSAAAARTAAADSPGQLRIAGLDVAGPGTDKTVLLFRQGPLTRYLWRGHEPDTMTTARRALDICLKERVQYLVVDDAGIGGRVVERMRLILKEEPLYKSIRVIAFNGGAKPKDTKRFNNANAEIYWRTRLWLNEPDSSIENDRILIGQLTARKYELNPKGQIVVESKRDMRKRGLSKSPDEADALAMTFAIRQKPSTGELGESKESIWTS